MRGRLRSLSRQRQRPTFPEGRVMGGVDLNGDRTARETLTVKCNIDEETDIAPMPNHAIAAIVLGTTTPPPLWTGPISL